MVEVALAAAAVLEVVALGVAALEVAALEVAALEVVVLEEVILAVIALEEVTLKIVVLEAEGVILNPVEMVQIMERTLPTVVVVVEVSKLTGIPTVSSILDKDGTPIDPNHRMLKQLPDMLAQLEWMAVAMKNQRELTGTF